MLKTSHIKTGKQIVKQIVNRGGWVSETHVVGRQPFAKIYALVSSLSKTTRLNKPSELKCKHRR